MKTTHRVSANYRAAASSSSSSSRCWESHSLRTYACSLRTSLYCSSGRRVHFLPSCSPLIGVCPYAPSNISSPHTLCEDSS
ncbi:hypothetical protein FHG87_008421 [Trinorchestia longiramus]|nr:hypothetical protein FHG87_008421 [Trinorchestia longiramus]